jgi:hypothetical protein
MRRQRLTHRSRSPLESGRGRVVQGVGLAVNEVGSIRVVGTLEEAGMCPSTMTRGVVRGPLTSDEARLREGDLVGIRREGVRAGADAD